MKRASHTGSARKAGVPLRDPGKGRKRGQQTGSSRAYSGGRNDNGPMLEDETDFDDEDQFDDLILAPADKAKNLAALRKIEQLREDRRLQMELDDYPVS
ncbi:MAG: hypothetical protein OEY45_00260 [Gammaproteobacteria bacterium]|nr:hypothetical protein [Gammaproteobacteria bacterium]MDH5513575.1 hypothetical protein [Gammaproteobacteria bacterium]